MAFSTRSPSPVTLTTPDTCRAHPRGQHLSHSGRWSAALVPALAALSLLLAACSQSAPATSAAQTTAGRHPSATAGTGAGTSSGSPVKVYFSKHPDSDRTPTAVFAVTRVAPTPAVATYAMEQLIAGPTASEKTAGYFTELTTVLHRSEPSNCGDADFGLTLDHRGGTPEPGTATLQFCRPTTSPGIGADARITAEITRTLTQFASITTVVLLNLHGDCFGDLSGMNRCLH